MPHQLVRKVLGRAKTFSNKFHHFVSQAKCWCKAKRNSARNAICVKYPETIKTAIYNEWNGGLMKRLRQRVADPLWPTHEKRTSRQNAYKAASLPLWSAAENSPSGAIITFSLWQSSNSHTLTNGLKLLHAASLLLRNASTATQHRPSAYSRAS